MNENQKIIVAVLAGAAVGAALGILFAPDKGSVTREKIREGADDLTVDAAENIAVLKKSIDEGIDKILGIVEEVKKTGNNAK